MDLFDDYDDALGLLWLLACAFFFLVGPYFVIIYSQSVSFLVFFFTTVFTCLAIAIIIIVLVVIYILNAWVAVAGICVLYQLILKSRSLDL